MQSVNKSDSVYLSIVQNQYTKPYILPPFKFEFAMSKMSAADIIGKIIFICNRG